MSTKVGLSQEKPFELGGGDLDFFDFPDVQRFIKLIRSFLASFRSQLLLTDEHEDDALGVDNIPNDLFSG